LLASAVLGLVWANSIWSDSYFSLIKHTVPLGLIDLDLKHLISEGFMALFFLVVVLEIKRELIDGELRTWKKASFPVYAAIGGMLLPAFIYSLLNPDLPQSRGWAIPIATDIAIAVGALALLGKDMPKNVRILLLALAIIDDIGSIAVIALFYSQPASALAMLCVITALLLLAVTRSSNNWLFWFTILGLVMWYSLQLAGISGTLAGVMLAALSPLTTRKAGKKKLQLSEKIEDILLPITTHIVVPLFVLTNVGLVFEKLTLTKGNGLMVFMGTSIGLVLGKPLGILSVSWLATKIGLTKKPNDIKWMHVLGVGCLAGIGFTVSLLIANLSFSQFTNFQHAAVLGIFTGSMVSGIIGLIILRKAQINT
jgi:Na+:H+ antiporter, NhaA family